MKPALVQTTILSQPKGPPPNLMDGIAWVQYQCDIAFQGDYVKFIKNASQSPRGAKRLDGLTLGATYRCIGTVRRGTIAAGKGIWFRVTGDQPMTANKLLELTTTTENTIAVNHTFVASVTTVYVGAVGLADLAGEVGKHVEINIDFHVEHVSNP